MSTPGHPTTPEAPCQSPLTLPGIPGPPKWPSLRASDFAQLVGLCSDAAGYVVGHRHNGTQPDVGAYRRQLDAQLDRCGIRSPEARARLHDELTWWTSTAERMPLDAPTTKPRTPGPGAARPDRGRGPTRYGWEAAADRIQAKAQRSLPDPDPGPPAPRPPATNPARESPDRIPEPRPTPGAPAARRPLAEQPATACRILVVIAAHAGRGGWGWMSRATIARLAGCSSTYLERVIPRLLRDGLIEASRRTGYRGRRGAALQYRLNRGAVRQPPPVPPPQGGA